MPRQIEEKLIDVHAVAELVGAHPQTVRSWTRKGRFPPPQPIGPATHWRRWHLWRPVEVRRWLDDKEGRA